jgi:predicted Zn-ribbon and HTH transcriptional regulator
MAAGKRVKCKNCRYEWVSKAKKKAPRCPKCKSTDIEQLE